MTSKPAALALLALIVASAPAAAQSPEPLPDPLTLADAIRLARDEHPSLLQLAAQQAQREAAVDRALAERGWQATITLDARTVDKVAIPGHAFRDDSTAELQVRKRLLDFGYSDAAIAAAEATREGVAAIARHARALHEIDIMEKFVDVVATDLRYFVDDEDMTVAFLRYDRVRERREMFSEFAEVDEKALETVFRDRLVDRARTANEQRLSRNGLALAMGRPGQLADRLIRPDLDVYDREVPDYDELLEQVLAAHPLVEANRLAVEAARREVQAAEYLGRPRVHLNLEATEWSLEVGNRDEYVAGLELEWPFGDRPVRDAVRAAAIAERQRAEAIAVGFEYELRQRVLELVQKLSELEFERRAAEVNENYRELNLERSRTLYELEVRSDLGDSSARQAEAVWRRHRAAFDHALTWARIDAMRGLPLAILNAEATR